MEPLTEQPLATVLGNTWAAVGDLAAELPAASRRGPAAVAELLMAEERRQYIGIALASAALLLLLFLG